MSCLLWQMRPVNSLDDASLQGFEPFSGQATLSRVRMDASILCNPVKTIARRTPLLENATGRPFPAARLPRLPDRKLMLGIIAN